MDSNANYTTRYSRHGYQFNVRETYNHLPLQLFWTWVTGKGRAVSQAELTELMKRPGQYFLFSHLLWTWSLMALAFYLGALAINADIHWIITSVTLMFSWVLVVNRLRSLQATFHYLSHRSVVEDPRLAKLVSLICITTPLLYISWDNYCNSHVRTHHHLKILCSDVDPDQQFILHNKFRFGMPEREFWLRIWLTPFLPSYLLADYRQMFKDNLIEPDRYEVTYRIIFWCLSLSICWYFDFFFEFLLIFFPARFIFFLHSMWLQLVTEHLWLYQRSQDLSDKENYGRMTWGRFQGRPPVFNGILTTLSWWIKILAYDIPVRLYVYPQDLPNHDFHHRLPRMSYRQIANVRATLEGSKNLHGPMYEAWGFLSSLRLLRDHFCRREPEPFVSNHHNFVTNGEIE